MKRIVYGPLLAYAVMMASSGAAAQLPIPFAVEGRIGVASPTGNLGEQANTGFGSGATVSVQLIPNYGLYGGYSRTEFDLDVADNARAVDSGFAVGLTAAYPLFGAGIMPWFGSGLLLHDLAVQGATTVSGSSQIGFEVGGGITVPVAPRVRLTPGIGFRRYTAPLLAQAEASISYLTAGVGVNVAF